MQVPLTAYAEDCSFTGELDFVADRLSDFLAGTVEFVLGHVTFRALDDGRIVEAESAAIMRDDLFVVLASEPRGREELRTWTRQYPVVARVGPYLVRGYVHAPPTIDPLKMASRRSILALTSSTVAYMEAGSPVQIEADAILINSARIDALEAGLYADPESGAADEETAAPGVGLGDLDLPGDATSA
jgi:hypothetical protein